MAIFDLFSKRKKAQADVPDVLSYELPFPLRVQLVQIFDDDVFTRDREHLVPIIVKVLRREYGTFRLPGSATDPPFLREPQPLEELARFVLGAEPEQVIDAIELIMKTVDTLLRRSDLSSNNADVILGEVNTRFREHGVGYQYEANKQIIQVTSEFLHAEAVKPALSILSDPRYEGANEEFRSAHEHYRHGKNKEVLVDCLKTFESVLKVICDCRGWSLPKNPNASQLVKAAVANGLFPAFEQTQLNHLEGVLTSGVPTLRNKTSAHGQGGTPVVVPDHFAQYALSLTASTIRFLAECDEVLR